VTDSRQNDTESSGFVKSGKFLDYFKKIWRRACVCIQPWN